MQNIHKTITGGLLALNCIVFLAAASVAGSAERTHPSVALHLAASSADSCPHVPADVSTGADAAQPSFALPALLPNPLQPAVFIEVLEPVVAEALPVLIQV